MWQFRHLFSDLSLKIAENIQNSKESSLKKRERKWPLMTFISWAICQNLRKYVS